MTSKLKDLNISKKILLSFVIVVVLYIATVGAALVGSASIVSSFEEFHNVSYSIVKETTNFRLNQYVVARNMFQIAYEKDTVSAIKDLNETKQCIASVEEAVKNIEALHQDKTTVEEMKTLYEQIVIPREKVMSLLEKEKYDEAMKVYRDEYDPLSREVRAFLREMENEAKEEAEVYYAESKSNANVMQLTLIALAIVTILFVSVIWYIITRSITRPLKEIELAAKELSQGNLKVEIEYSSKNELGSLAESMRDTIKTLADYLHEIEQSLIMLGKGKLNYRTKMKFRGDFVTIAESLDRISKMLSESMLKINNSAEQVSGGAQQISNGAQMLSQGASEQSGSIEELAANINEISDNVKNNADDTVAASHLADRVERDILENSDQMDEVTRSIEEIKQNSLNITSIVKEIEDIAFQTNLLSLNAAVEAARAGDAGRGFSVVASEIRKLAAKATEASKLTAELIQKSTQSVEEGSLLIDSTEESMKHIVEGAREVAAKIESISQANVQQANFIIQIRQSIEQISDIVQGNSATSEESAAASEELAAQAQILKELVNSFEIQEKDEIDYEV